MTDECVVDGCKLRSNTSGHCMFEKNRSDGLHPLGCEYGRFARIVHDELGDLGGWRLFEYSNGPIRATLRGTHGTVEVWGGDTHRSEVWFVERGTKAETMLCDGWGVADGSLREAVERGCAMAGMQARLAV